jgi:lipopolysaccharide transport system permease protein
MSTEQEAIAIDNLLLTENLTENRPVLDDVTFTHVSQRQLAWNDVKEGMQNWRIWALLSYQDIKLRYRRSVLGPFWITLSMAITVYSMGYLYSYLFHMNIRDYFPYLVAGMLGWSLISTTMTDLIDTFTQSDMMIKQIKLPYSLYVQKVVARNFIIFSHNILVMVPILIIFHQSAEINLSLLMLIPGLLLVYINAISFGLVLAMIGARYRDVSQMIKSMIQVIFYITPVMWKPDLLPPSKRFIATLNPFYSFIELVRGPFIGYIPSRSCYIMALVMTLIGIVASYLLFFRSRARIIYWI